MRSNSPPRLGSIPFLGSLASPGLLRILTLTVSLGSVVSVVGSVHAVPHVTLSGFVDTSISYRFLPEAEAKKGVTLGLDQVELDVSVAVGGGLKVRTDLQLFPAEGATALGFDRIVEQGFAEFFFAGEDKGFFLRAGKWNAPVGFEVIDPTGLWQYSQGLLFMKATPSNLTGFAFGWAGESTQAQLWVSNDWDTPSTPKDATLGLRVQQGLGDVGTVGLSSTLGALNDEKMRFMADLDLSFVFGALKLGGEFNFGKLGGDTSIGFLLSANYAFSDRVSVTGRFDFLDREITDNPYKGMSATLAGLFNLTKGFDLIAEVRADLPKDADEILGGALELLGSF